MVSNAMPQRNNEGFLEDAQTWTEGVATAIAAEDDVDLTEKHVNIFKHIFFVHVFHDFIFGTFYVNF